MRFSITTSLFSIVLFFCFHRQLNLLACLRLRSEFTKLLDTIRQGEVGGKKTKEIRVNSKEQQKRTERKGTAEAGQQSKGGQKGDLKRTKMWPIRGFFYIIGE